jgi:Asp-tRNA(Asn)/Glu-tRNA(Gln) amidotransferase A subunit family amidase
MFTNVQNSHRWMVLPDLLLDMRTDQIGIIDFIQQLERVYNQREAELMAFLPEINRFERLYREAEDLQNKYPDPNDRPLLFGLPIGVKDIFHVEGFPTHAGSKLPIEAMKGSEAKSVRKLKKSGAIIFGKTVTTEFAYLAPGPTKNPHRSSYSPGGSSSGSAAAVAAGLVPFAFGTQTIGSVIRPASYCGVVGFKPTYGRIDIEGVIPLAPSVDTIGFFTNNVSSAEFMAAVLCKEWMENGFDRQKPVLGIPKGPYLENANLEMWFHFVEVCKKLENSGFEILELQTMLDFDEIYNHHNVIVAYEAANTHKIWFSRYKELYHPKSIELIMRGQSFSLKDYQLALDSREKLRDKLTSEQIRYGIDLWISPPARGAAPKGFTSTGNPIMNLPWTHCGFPTINIPSSMNPIGLPMGFQVSAGWLKDEALLHWGLEIESVLSN